MAFFGWISVDWLEVDWINVGWFGLLEVGWFGSVSAEWGFVENLFGSDWLSG